jgi:CheY-like chemotaxis protein
LLVVDDLVSSRLLLKMFLEQKAGVRVVEAETSEQALRLARRRRFDLVISDIVRPGMDGLTFLRAFKKAHPSVPVMIVSGALSPALRQRACRLSTTMD